MASSGVPRRLRAGGEIPRTAHVGRISDAGRAAELAREEAALAVFEVKRLRIALARSERMAALGEVTSRIVHEFNNAVAPIVGLSEMLLRGPAPLDPEARSDVEVIHSAAQDAVALLRKLRAFYRPREGAVSTFVPTSLAAVAADALALLGPRLNEKPAGGGGGIRIARRLAEAPPILADPAELREAVLNLLVNAADAMPDGGDIAVTTGADRGRAFLAVRDAGTGMSSEVRNRCLEPFFSTKGSRGSGLGLAITNAIADRHDGTIDIATAPGAGTVVTLTFPPIAAPSAAAST